MLFLPLQLSNVSQNKNSGWCLTKALSCKVFLLGILRFYSFALFFKSISTENVESLSWEEIKSPYYFLKTKEYCKLCAYVCLPVQACALVLVGMHA